MVIKVRVINVPTIIMSPWAKFSMPRDLYTIVTPTAISAYRLPFVRPFNIC